MAALPRLFWRFNYFQRRRQFIRHCLTFASMIKMVTRCYLLLVSTILYHLNQNYMFVLVSPSPEAAIHLMANRPYWGAIFSLIETTSSLFFFKLDDSLKQRALRINTRELNRKLNAKFRVWKFLFNRKTRAAVSCRIAFNSFLCPSYTFTNWTKKSFKWEQLTKLTLPRILKHFAKATGYTITIIQNSKIEATPWRLLLIW